MFARVFVPVLGAVGAAVVALGLAPTASAATCTASAELTPAEIQQLMTPQVLLEPGQSQPFVMRDIGKGSKIAASSGLLQASVRPVGEPIPAGSQRVAIHAFVHPNAGVCGISGVDGYGRPFNIPYGFLGVVRRGASIQRIFDIPPRKFRVDYEPQRPPARGERYPFYIGRDRTCAAPAYVATYNYEGLLLEGTGGSKHATGLRAKRQDNGDLHIRWRVRSGYRLCRVEVQMVRGAPWINRTKRSGSYVVPAGPSLRRDATGHADIAAVYVAVAKNTKR